MRAAGDATVSSGGRTVGFVDYGPAEGKPVVWCPGGPGSRLRPSVFAPNATASGLRMNWIDRAGYGLSTLDPGRAVGARESAGSGTSFACWFVALSVRSRWSLLPRSKEGSSSVRLPWVVRGSGSTVSRRRVMY